MHEIVAKCNARFTWYFLLMMPATLGVGSVVLWFWRRSFVYSVNQDGIRLYSGRVIPWSGVQSLLARKGVGEKAGTVSRLDIDYVGGHARVVPSWLQNGDEVCEALRTGFREFRQHGTPMRVHYTQRRR